MATLWTSALPPPTIPPTPCAIDFLAYRHPSIPCSAARSSSRHGGGGRRPADGTSAHPSARGRVGRGAGAPCCRWLRRRVSHGGPSLDAPSGPYAFSSDGERETREKGNTKRTFRQLSPPVDAGQPLLSSRRKRIGSLFVSSCPSASRLPRPCTSSRARAKIGRSPMPHTLKIRHGAPQRISRFLHCGLAALGNDWRTRAS